MQKGVPIMGPEDSVIIVMWEIFGVDVDTSVATMPRPESFI
jgi:hypothetical protein